MSEDHKWCDGNMKRYQERIAALEAENARLTDANEKLNQPMPPDGFCRGDFEHLKRERDEARAACAAKDEALVVCRTAMWDGMSDRVRYGMDKAFDFAQDALSSTSGSEFLAEHAEVVQRLTSTNAVIWEQHEVKRKNLEFTVADRDRLHAQRDELQARLESLSAELRSCHQDFDAANNCFRKEESEHAQTRARLAVQVRKIETLNKLLTDTQAQLKKVQATAEQEESKLRGVNRELAARREKAEAERESMRRLVANLNAKLDDTHTHRCFRCDATVTGKTAGMQAQIEAMRAALIQIDNGTQDLGECMSIAENALKQDGECVCAETSTRNCSVHGNDDKTEDGT